MSESLRRTGRFAPGLFGAVLVLLVAFAGVASAADPAPAGQGVEVAVSLPLSGDEAPYGQPVLEGVQLAIDEANAAGITPHIELRTFDDKGDDSLAKQVAGEVVASRAVLLLGPAFSTNSLAAGPVYAAGGIVSLATTCTSDLITESATTFRVLFKNSDQGETLALYLSRVLHQQRADVILVDNGYGRTLRDGFQRAAGVLGINAQYFAFKTPAEQEDIAHRIVADPSRPPVVFMTLDADAERMLTILRRGGVTGPFLGGDALGDELLSQRFANQPEEREHPGFFTDGLLGISPVILDSANADTLAFAERFRARFGHDPLWQAVTGYDAAHLAVDTLKGLAFAGGLNGDTDARRRAVLNYLTSLNSPTQALPGLLGPFWFDAERGRPQAVRIGRFNHVRFESAPLQIVPVTSPDSSELASKAVFETAPGRYGRLQRVVYTGIFLNEIPRIDLGQASFGADFYLWLRFASDAGPGAADPTDINFPNLVSGGFDRARPAEQGDMPDGTVYRLWRVQGTFRNDFDLHRFPFDRQALALPFFNARAAADRIVYVLDKRSTGGRNPGPPSPTGQGGAQAAVAASIEPSGGTASIASPAAFRNLTQWDALGAHERRENLVTDSALGDPRRVGVESYRELSGFLVTVDVRRRALATLSKTLMPLFLMTLIMFASLYFPVALVKEKVTVAITGALSGAVLLSAINSQLGSIGYTVALEYAFYIFFALSTLCIVSVLGAERLRAAGRAAVAVRTDQLTRAVFLLAVAVIVAGAIGLWFGGQ
jgi:branched-chain amino acid transport system substrate-binding protein